MSHAPRIPAARARGPPLTHFIGLSLITPASRPQLQASVDAFRDATRNDKDLLIPEPVAKFAIRPVDTLHLTICTLSLPEKEPERLQEVISHLKELDLKKLWQEANSESETDNASMDENSRPNQDIKQEATNTQKQPPDLATTVQTPEINEKPPPLRVTLKGMKTMRSASKTTVVYAPPDEPTKPLQSFCKSIREDFRPYLSDNVPERNPEPEPEPEKTKPPSAPTQRPTLESFPHPDSYKSDISVPATPAPAPSSENVPFVPEGAALTPEAGKEKHLSKRQQKRQAKKDKDDILLHATLLNTIYVRKQNRKDRRRIEIDARPLLERFGETVWMKDVKIEKLCLFRMGAKEVMDENGKGTGIVRYVPEAERDLDF